MTHKLSPQFELVAALPDQKPVLANLLQLYIYDFSEILGVDLEDDGRFAYPHLQLYWSEPGRYPFLITVEEKPAGFVLVKTGSDWDVHDMAEFFVLRLHRRLGVGTQMAHEVWRRLPGRWEVRVMEVNVAARDFWGHAIESFTGQSAVPARLEQDGLIWQVFSFEAPGEP